MYIENKVFVEVTTADILSLTKGTQLLYVHLSCTDYGKLWKIPAFYIQAL